MRLVSIPEVDLGLLWSTFLANASKMSNAESPLFIRFSVSVSRRGECDGLRDGLAQRLFESSSMESEAALEPAFDVGEAEVVASGFNALFLAEFASVLCAGLLLAVR